jgi:hypothetical protein
MSANKPIPGGRTPPPIQLVRLTEEQVQALERQLTPCDTNSQTTPIQAGQIIGVQMTLRALRKGWVV